MPSLFPSDPPTAVDSRHFRQALSQFATGVTTALPGGRPLGVTINSFNSVSLDPPLVLWSLAHTASSMAAFEAAGVYVINVLAHDQADLAQRFARCGEDRFETVDFTLSPQGMPVLAGTVASFECRARSRYAEGDHVIFIGAVERRQFHPHRSLGFHRGRFIAIS
ncbi:flavin reductase family protein [Massilia antarctica]|uniref:flavin reductase family protein n=1 Tax=Massilia antarctica TaxID=2765360 RepID=UPI0006BB7DF3|nr:flavin reductase family protein [Massilia sp. H27-R4]MCY0910740.1 flavin reductase family protein [Massilia sp. H27-R4]CUI08882.1 NADH-FMN oxidoreductase [Janthinobacterium sp. CG23_2]CUU32668.1 NADH-FMN oxidoreductase [Janthinobacterium sp. CG23_2]